MTKYTLVVAALLLANFVGYAAAADEPEHESKNARKVIVLLNSMGIDDKNIHSLVEDVDSRIGKGYFHIAEEKMMGGKLTLRYRLRDGVSTKQIQLHFAPENSNFEAVASREGVMVHYRLKF